MYDVDVLLLNRTVEEAWRVTAIARVPAVAYSFIMLVTCSYTASIYLRQRKSAQTKSNGMHWKGAPKVFWFLYGMVISACCCLGGAFIATFITTSEGDGPLCYFIYKWTSTWYVCTGFFKYIFLEYRARGVLDVWLNGATELIKKRMILLRKVTLVFIYLSPSVSILVIIWFHGILINNRFCVNYGPEFLYILFLIGDSGISILLLIQFIVPLDNLTKTVGKGKKGSSSRAVVKRNLIGSAIACFSTFIAMTSPLVFYAVGDVVTNETAVSLAVWDVVINTVVASWISKCWRPSFASKRVPRNGRTVSKRTTNSVAPAPSNLFSSEGESSHSQN